MRRLMTMTALIYSVGFYSFGGATMAQGRGSWHPNATTARKRQAVTISDWTEIVFKDCRALLAFIRRGEECVRHAPVL